MRRMVSSASTVIELLGAGADEAVAIGTPGGTPLRYRELRQLAADTVAALNGHGVGRNDRVAIVLGNGARMATPCLAGAAGATAAPLNAAYRADELEFYLTDLRARLLIVEGEEHSPATEMADKLGVPVARLTER